jgi:hypothetical protein
VGITEAADCVVVVVSEERHVISIANNGFIKKDYFRSDADFHNEATFKSIQKQLIRDLTRLLTGESPEDEKPDRQGFRVEFKLGFGLDKEDRERRKREKEEAQREKDKQGRDGKKNRRSAAYKVTARFAAPAADTAKTSMEETPAEGVGMTSILRVPEDVEKTEESLPQPSDTAPVSEENTQAPEHSV